eukprot:5897366-Pyramimonas_sp.AAC.1
MPPRAGLDRPYPWAPWAGSPGTPRQLRPSASVNISAGTAAAAADQALREALARAVGPGAAQAATQHDGRPRSEAEAV